MVEIAARATCGFSGGKVRLALGLAEAYRLGGQTDCFEVFEGGAVVPYFYDLAVHDPEEPQPCPSALRLGGSAATREFGDGPVDRPVHLYQIADARRRCKRDPEAGEHGAELVNRRFELRNAKYLVVEQDSRGVERLSLG